MAIGNLVSLFSTAVCGTSRSPTGLVERSAVAWSQPGGPSLAQMLVQLFLVFDILKQKIKSWNVNKREGERQQKTFWLDLLLLVSYESGLSTYDFWLRRFSAFCTISDR